MRHTPCGCRSAHLAGVRSNFRLPPVPSMRRAPAMPHSAGSLPPDKRHSRLTKVRRGCKRSRLAGIHGAAMYTAPTLRSACSHSSYKPAMSGVEGDSPRPFSRGFKGDTLFREREYPPYCVPCGTQGTKCRAPRCQKSRLSAKKKERLFRGVLLIFAKVKFTDTSACRRWRGRGRRRRRW